MVRLMGRIVPASWVEEDGLCWIWWACLSCFLPLLPPRQCTTASALRVRKAAKLALERSTVVCCLRDKLWVSLERLDDGRGTIESTLRRTVGVSR